MGERLLGAQELLGGYVTTVASIARKPPRELELALGLNSGSLSSGFYVFALDAPVGLGDFEWKDRTMYSDGWHFDRRADEFVQRQDELRAHLGRLSAYDEVKTDAQLLDHMCVHAHRLNVRVGPNRIVKVVPKGLALAYPDSSYRAIPQWRLRTKKPFVLLADVPTGRWYD